MIKLLRFLLALMTTPLRPMWRFDAENSALRQRLNVLIGRFKSRLRLTNSDHWFFAVFYSLSPLILDAEQIVQPETLVLWHRAGFRFYWQWKSRHRVGRPKFDAELRALNKRINDENPLWRAPRIYGELSKHGFDVAQSTIAKYISNRKKLPPGQDWQTCLRNHLPEIAAMDFFVVPTLGLELLYAFVIIHLNRRPIVWSNLTRHPTLEWVARQIAAAFPWDEAARYLTREHCSTFSALVKKRLRAMEIRDKPSAPRSPWQNACAERLIRSI